ncbi:hypothetical protein [Nocardioides sp. NPDC006303]|uniref:hypothetical protein n=1 Tax=Nocardioides sp. NPDC006303 TaxID=3156747 RepID=UPI0033A5F137
MEPREIGRDYERRGGAGPAPPALANAGDQDGGGHDRHLVGSPGRLEAGISFGAI